MFWAVSIISIASKLVESYFLRGIVAKFLGFNKIENKIANMR